MRTGSRFTPRAASVWFNVVIAIFVLSGGRAIAQPGAGRGAGPGAGSGPPSNEPTFAKSLHATGGVQYSAGTGEVVADVQIRGNRFVPEAKIWSHIRTRSGRAFDPQILESDVRRLTSVSGLFRDVQTYIQRTSEGVHVTFNVVERPTISYVKFIGNYRVSDKVLLRESGLNVGDALNIYSIREAQRRLQEFYQTRGFVKTEIEILEGDRSTDKGIVFDVAESTVERIWKVNFIGNKIASDGRLNTLIQSKPGYFKYLFRGKVERSKIDEDVERLTAYYRGLGYFRARIGRELEYNDEGNWVTLTFVIDEGPRYIVRSVSVEGNQVFESSDLMQELTLLSGDYFHLGSMNRDVRSIRDRYGEFGYYFADISADPRFLEEPGQLDLVYNISEGKQYRVGNITVKIKGEFPHTRESVVLNRMSIREGDVLDTREIERSERRIGSSQLFETNPARGNAPKITVRPSDIESSTPSVAEHPRTPRAGSRAVRGQSPDSRKSANSATSAWMRWFSWK